MMHVNICISSRYATVKLLNVHFALNLPVVKIEL